MTPIWGAASLIPGAWYMVVTMTATGASVRAQIVILTMPHDEPLFFPP